MRACHRSWILATLLSASPHFVAAQTTEPSTEPTTSPATLPTTEPTTLSTTFPTSEPMTDSATEPTTNPTTEPTTNPTTEPTTNPTTQPTTSPTSQPATQPAEPEPLSGIVEGTFFPERQGRLQRSKDGKQVLFVYDKDGKQMAVPILQNLDLMRLENAIEKSGWNLHFRASGWITEYQGKNYILFDEATQVDEKTGADAPKTVR